MKRKLCLLIMFCCVWLMATANCIAVKKIGQGYNDTAVVLIPFEYKQSALFHAFTYEVIDSVVNLLLKNDKITLTIKGFAQADEGGDSVCKWLSDDRALFVKKYILGRGVNEDRIAFTQGMGAKKSSNSIIDKNNHAQYFRAELVLNIPPPPPPIIADRDEDGILNEDDTCPDVFGYADNKGCPDSNAIIIPFGNKEDWLASFTYKALDSVVNVMRQNKQYTLSIQGHAHKTEGNPGYCQQLAINRALVVKKYLLSRNIAAGSITTITSYSSSRPLNAAKNPAAELANSRVQIFIHR